MPHRDGGLAAVEVAHLARAHVRGADRQARRAAFDERKVDQLGERLREWRRRVEAGAVASERIVRAEKSQRIGLKESGNAAEQGRPIGCGVGEPRPVRQTPEFLTLHAAPEFLQPVEAMLALVAGDQAGVDGADRGADDPVRIIPVSFSPALSTVSTLAPARVLHSPTRFVLSLPGQSAGERFHPLPTVETARREDGQSCALIRRQIHNSLNCLVQSNTVPQYIVDYAGGLTILTPIGTVPPN